MPKLVTFQEGRDTLLALLDESYQRVRAEVSRPRWCNEDYPPFQSAFKKLAETVLTIRRLNETQAECQDAATPPR